MPMFWDLLGQQFTGDNVFNSTNIGQAVTLAGNGGIIMFLNEAYNGTPGVTAGAVTPQDAATAWKTLCEDSRVQAANIRLMSPATTDSPTAQQWFRTWWGLIDRKPDIISVHKYASSAQSTSAAVSTILSGITDTKARYPGYPIALTEFAMQFNATDLQQTDLMDSIIPTLEADPAVIMYNHFWGGPRSIPALVSYTDFLYNDDASPSNIGIHYATFP